MIAEVISERWPLVDGHTADQLENYLLRTIAENLCQVDLSNGWSVCIFTGLFTNHIRTMEWSWRNIYRFGHNAGRVVEHKNAWAALDYLDQVMHNHERTMDHAESVYQRMRTDPMITEFVRRLATKEDA